MSEPTILDANFPPAPVADDAVGVPKTMCEREFVRSIRRKAKAKETEWEYVPNAETRAAIEECESGAELETLDIANFKDYIAFG